jgi:hypothetical protein
MDKPVGIGRPLLVVAFSSHLKPIESGVASICPWHGYNQPAVGNFHLQWCALAKAAHKVCRYASRQRGVEGFSVKNKTVMQHHVGAHRYIKGFSVAIHAFLFFR